MMNKIRISLLLLAFLTVAGFAQDADTAKVKYGWKKEMAAGVNMTQTSFSNYVQGGENTLAWQFNFNFKFEDDQEKSNWSNSGRLNYGMTKVGDDASQKSIDEVMVETVYKQKLGIIVDPFAAATAQTQLGPGYNYGTDPRTQISDIIDPLYFRESVGVGYKPRPEIATRLGASMKQTLTHDYPAPYADDPKTTKIEKTRYEYGMESVTDLDLKLSSTSKITSKLQLFSNLEAFDEIDVNWDTLLSSKISKYLSMNFNVKVIYDKDISKKRQLMQALALGVSYNFY